MKVLSAAVLLLTVFSIQACTAAPSNWDDTLNDLWRQYKSGFDKRYATTAEENHRRLQWELNLERIRDHNLRADLGIESYYMGVNQLADLSPDEFAATYLSGRISKHRHSTSGVPHQTSRQKLPDTVDWRKEGYVTKVKNQGSCGSCWAFASTGSLEGQVFRKTHRLISLSEQQLVDCSHHYPYLNHGCLGGLMDAAYHYVKDAGITSEADYPYSGTFFRKCTYKESMKVASCSGWTDLPTGNESALQDAVATVGPISVAIDATQNFQLYKRGVFSDKTCSSERKSLDHGVLVVGYGTQSNTPYWLIKNSWGASWGMNGYIMMRRNHGNECGVSTLASYPLV